MGTWVRERDVGKGKVVPDNGTQYCKAKSIKAVVTGQGRNGKGIVGGGQIQDLDNRETGWGTVWETLS